MKCSRYISGDLEDLASFLDVPDESLEAIVKKYKKESVRAYQLLKAWMSAGNSDREDLIEKLEGADYTEAANR